MAATTCWRPATGRFAIDSVDRAREPYLVADVTPLDDEVGDEPRAERLAASAIRRFVRYLELMRARDGETAEALDIRVELETARCTTDDAVDDLVGRPEPVVAADCDRSMTMREPPTARDLSSPTTRPSSRTCSRGSSRSSSHAARRCSRPRRPSSDSRRSSACSTASSCSWQAGCGCSRRTHA